ncbi:MAG: hypothetical protein RR956_07390 [Christensenella sp.]
MKKIISVLLCLFAVTCISACGVPQSEYDELLDYTQELENKSNEFAENSDNYIHVDDIYAYVSNHMKDDFISVDSAYDYIFNNRLDDIINDLVGHGVLSDIGYFTIKEIATLIGDELYSSGYDSASKFVYDNYVN